MIPASAAQSLEDVATRLRALRAWLATRTDSTDSALGREGLTLVSKMATELDDQLRDAISIVDSTFDVTERIVVPSEADAAAISLTTAYLDGVVRDDGFDLLSLSITELLSAPDVDMGKVAALLAASARLCSALALGTSGSPEAALSLIQATALARSAA